MNSWVPVGLKGVRRDCLCSALFLEGRDDALHEGGQIVGGAAGDDVAVADAGSVLPDAAGVFDVVANGEEAGHFPTLEAFRRAEHPGTVADGREDLALLAGLGDQVDHRRMSAHVVGRIAAGDDDRVEVGRLDLAGGDVGLGGISVLRGVGFARLGPTILTSQPASRSRRTGYHNSRSS